MSKAYSVLYDLVAHPQTEMQSVILTYMSPCGGMVGLTIGEMSHCFGNINGLLERNLVEIIEIEEVNSWLETVSGWQSCIKIFQGLDSFFQ